MGTYDRDGLLADVRSGKRVKYLFFWGHTPAADGSIGPSSLSQWWPCRFEIDGITYTSAEHWMMAEKARLFGDEETLTKILSSRTPAEAKNFGRLVTPFDNDRWNSARFEIVTAGNVAKFGQNDALRAYLLATRNRVLVEASPVDRVWGIGLEKNDPNVSNPELWRGENLLGFALMAARDQLAAK
jgi:ribA/ribD-fused uncharacterized protein